jgi:beta-glucosidase
MTPSLPHWQHLSLTQQVAQLFIVRAAGYLFDHEIKYPQWESNNAKLQHLIENLGVGGVILLGGSAAEIKLRTEKLQNWAKIPLLVAADVEEGVGQRFSGATWFPPPMALSSIYQYNPSQGRFLATKMGEITAKESLAIGINWVLAPIVDVNNNPDNPVINIRAFGENPPVVADLTRSFIRGCQQYPVLTTAKHFPGHGDTNVDSHLDLPVLSHDLTRLNAIELPPFQSAINQGVDTVMTAHLLIPELDQNYPATLSKKILTELLRYDLNFDGLIVTDALVMGAITKVYGDTEAVILALEAGADLLLMPVDAEKAINAICEAVRSQRIPLERIHASLERIYKAKNKLFINHNYQGKLTDLDNYEALNIDKEITELSQQYFGKIPLKPVKNARNLIIVDDIFNAKYIGRHTPCVTICQNLGYELQICDRHTPPISDRQEHFTPTVLQVFLRGNPFRGSAGISPLAEKWVKKLLQTGELQALIIYGSPYILEQWRSQIPMDIPCIFSYSQTPTAQAIALNNLFTSSE